MALTAGVGIANAADLTAPPPVAPAAATVSNWDGFYAGIFAGYSFGTLTTTDDSPGITSPYHEDYSGYLLGLQTGYNFHLSDSIVGGFSVDAAYNNASTSDPSYDTTLNWSGSATVRLGVDMDSIVPYVLGGVAVANASITDMGPGPGSDTQTHIGYTVGAGVEMAVADNISANVEYRYTDYGIKTYVLTNDTASDLADSSVRVGLNYHFH